MNPDMYIKIDDTRIKYDNVTVWFSSLKDRKICIILDLFVVYQSKAFIK